MANKKAIESEVKRQGRRLTLKFLSDTDPELDFIEFNYRDGDETAWLKREALEREKSFTWTAVPQALALLFLDYLCWHKAKKQEDFIFPKMDEQSLAVSIGDDRYRDTGIVRRLFIHKRKGGEITEQAGITLRVVFHRGTNRPRAIRINWKFLPPDCVEVFWGDQGKLRKLRDIQELAKRIRKSPGLVIARQEQRTRFDSRVGLGQGMGFRTKAEEDVSTPVSTFLRLHQLPAPLSVFEGRNEELDKLEQTLRSNKAAGATISSKHAALQGMGGVGKTALAVMLAHRLIDQYPDAQLVLNLRGAGGDQAGGYKPVKVEPVTPVEAMQMVIHAYHPEAKLPAALDELAPIYRSVLASKIQVEGKRVPQRVLLLLDNAADALQVRPLLPPANCLLLVTSRAKFRLPGLVTSNLDCLKPKNSRDLLLILAERIKGHEEQAAELCGHLPLALEVFAGIVNEKRLYPVIELLDRVRAHLEKLTAVNAAFQVSYELLSKERQRFWILLSVFPASFALDAAVAVWGERADCCEPDAEVDTNSIQYSQARDSMQALENASLVEFSEVEGRFRLHDLVRRFCSEKLDQDEPDVARFRYASHYCNVAADIKELFLEGGDKVWRALRLFDRERTHIDTSFDWLQHRRDRRSVTLFVSLIDLVGCIGGLRFHPRQRIRWLESLYEAALMISNRQAAGNALGYLGLAQFDLGAKRKAIEFYERSLAIYREIADRPGEGGALSNLGGAHADLGEKHKAIEFYECSMTIYREIADRRGEGAALANLGRAHADLGEKHKAVEFYERSLAIYREIADRPGEGAALGNLGGAHADLGEKHKAIEFYERSLTIYREIADRRGEGAALANLGDAHASLGEKRKAIEFYERSLTIYREIADHLNEAAGLNRLGIANQDWGDIRNAIQFYEQALIIVRKIGDRHGEATLVLNIGYSHALSGDMSKATEFLKQALIIYREIGDRHGEGNSLWISAQVFAHLGIRAQAVGRAKAALRILKAIENPLAATVRTQLSIWLGHE